MSVLSSKAMLAHISISAWSGFKVDKKATNEVNEANNADRDAGRYNKRLLDKEALAPIANAISSARTFHYDRTLPWSDEGARLLPAIAYMDYSAQVMAKKATFFAAVDTFVNEYQAHIDAARKRLGSLFNEADYLPAAEVRRRFGFELVISPVPAGEDFRVAIGDAQAALIRAEIEERAEKQLQAAVADIYRRISEHVGRMAEKLVAYQPSSGKGDKAQGVFRDSLVENLRDLVLVLPSLNITSDPHLSAIAKRMEAELIQHDATELRENPELRQSVAKAAAAILEDVSDFLA